MCKTCETMEAVAREATEREADLARHLENAERDMRQMRSTITRQKNQIEKANGEDAGAGVIREIIEFYAIESGHTRIKVSTAGARGDAVRKALRLGHSADEIKEAIRGACRYPFVVNYNRSKTGTEKQRFDDLPTVLRDEVQIQRMRRLAEAPVVSPGKDETPDLDRPTGAKTPIDRVLVAIWHQQWTCPAPSTWLTDCPVCFGHDRLTIVEREDGIVSLECELPGCELWRLLAALGLDANDLWDGSRAITGHKPATPAHLLEARDLLIARLAGS